MKFLGIIPARYDSTRLEGKILKKINGSTMIEWVYKRAIKSELDDLIVATDDLRIIEEVERFGGKAILTKKEHLNGTSRIAEVAEKFDDYDVLINIQGDEPLIEPNMINSLISAFKKEKLTMCTLKHRITKAKEIENPNNVKVVCDLNGYALYFSRSIIPYPRNENFNNYFKHVGIYAYDSNFLKDYAKMPVSEIESCESLEQLRVLENGYKIKVIETKYPIIGVDTEDDLNNVIEFIIKNDIKLI